MVKSLSTSLKSLLDTIQSDPALLSRFDPEAVKAASDALKKTETDVVRCFLDISTGHLPEADHRALDCLPEGKGPFHVVSSDYGWRLLVPDEQVLAEFPEALEGFSLAFKSLLDFARSRGCDYINLDADALFTDNLEYFEL